MKNILRLVRQRLIDWHIRGYAATSTTEIQNPVLSLRGLGKELWANEDADTFVRRLRAAWW